MMACSCSLIPTKEIQVTSKPIDRTIVQPVMPREIDLKEVSAVTFPAYPTTSIEARENDLKINEQRKLEAIKSKLNERLGKLC